MQETHQGRTLSETEQEHNVMKTTQTACWEMLGRIFGAVASVPTEGESDLR